jgi:mismatch-specific thymine-DNA glycosylase
MSRRSRALETESPYFSPEQAPTLKRKASAVIVGQGPKKVLRTSRSESVLSTSSAKVTKSHSVYAHLNGIPDALDYNLIFMNVGTNPGVMTATTGHAYAHRSNRFWKYLFQSGITNRLCRPEEDQDMPKLFTFGLTNIVGRPTKTGDELSKEEMREGVIALDEKAFKYKPGAILILGIEIWKQVYHKRKGKPIKPGEWSYGWQDSSMNFGKRSGFKGVPVYLGTSTSGLSTHPSNEEKARIWKEFGDWVNEQRAIRAQAVTVKSEMPQEASEGAQGGEGSVTKPEFEEILSMHIS